MRATAPVSRPAATRPGLVAITAVVIAAVALFAPAHGRRPAASPAAVPFDAGWLFGLRTVLTQVAGLAPTRFFDPPAEMDELILAGAVREDGQWRVRLLQPMPVTRGCRAEVVRGLVPGSPAILANCLNGGSDNIGYVAVLGVADGHRLPALLLTVTCGVTRGSVRDGVLHISSTGPQAGAYVPGAPQPEVRLRWEAGRLAVLDADRGAYRRHCVEGGGELGAAAYGGVG